MDKIGQSKAMQEYFAKLYQEDLEAMSKKLYQIINKHADDEILTTEELKTLIENRSLLPEEILNKYNLSKVMESCVMSYSNYYDTCSSSSFEYETGSNYYSYMGQDGYIKLIKRNLLGQLKDLAQFGKITNIIGVDFLRLGNPLSAIENKIAFFIYKKEVIENGEDVEKLFINVGGVEVLLKNMDNMSTYLQDNKLKFTKGLNRAIEGYLESFSNND